MYKYKIIVIKNELLEEMAQISSGVLRKQYFRLSKEERSKLGYEEYLENYFNACLELGTTIDKITLDSKIEGLDKFKIIRFKVQAFNNYKIKVGGAYLIKEYTNFFERKVLSHLKEVGDPIDKRLVNVIKSWIHELNEELSGIRQKTQFYIPGKNSAPITCSARMYKSYVKSELRRANKELNRALNPSRKNASKSISNNYIEYIEEELFVLNYNINNFKKKYYKMLGILDSNLIDFEKHSILLTEVQHE